MTNLGKSYIYRLFSWCAYVIPLAVLFVVNRDAYIAPESTIGFFGIVIIALAVIAFKDTVVNAFKRSPLMTLSIVLLVVGMMMESIAGQLSLIATASLIGSCLHLVVDKVADVYHDRAYRIVDGVKTRNREPALPDREAWREAYGIHAKRTGPTDGEEETK